jgi:hypothetical protein
MAKMQERRSLWEERVAAYKSSGQSVREWSEANGVKPGRMWYWLRRLRTENQEEQPTSWLQAVVSCGTVSGEQAGLVVRVGKLGVEVRPGFDPQLLRTVVKTLSTVC